IAKTACFSLRIVVRPIRSTLGGGSVATGAVAGGGIGRRSKTFRSVIGAYGMSLLSVGLAAKLSAASIQLAEAIIAVTKPVRIQFIIQPLTDKHHGEKQVSHDLDKPSGCPHPTKKPHTACHLRAGQAIVNKPLARP